jgi:type VI secretion system protein VasG
VDLNLKSLIGKLTDTARRALEGAAGLCVSRQHYEVEVEHWLAKLLEDESGDIPRVLRHFEVLPDRARARLERALAGFKTDNSRRPELSQSIPSVLADAWGAASVNYGLGKIRSGILLLAALSQRVVRRQLLDAVPELEQIRADELAAKLPAIVSGSAEDREVVSVLGASERDLPRAGAPSDSRSPALDQYTVDLTDEARRGRIDPVLGRDAEIRQIVDILTRRRQNNPILTGEAGVGKTAVVEGFALRIAAGDVPEPLKGVAVRSLDLGLLQAGAGVKGEFENRLKQVIEEVRKSATPIILFIDEAHTLIGAGGKEGQNDAANLLKPALARGELRTIAATTWAEYKKYFEKDAALTRRFQVVKVEEPAEDKAVAMMRGLASMLEKHHNVTILDEAVVESVRLSHRYLPARQLPDKSVSVLDTACARVAIGQGSTPAAIESLRRRIQELDRELEVLKVEAAIGRERPDRVAELRAERSSSETSLAELESRWEKERALVQRMNDVRRRLRPPRPEKRSGGVSPPPAEPPESEKTALREELRRLETELAGIQGTQRLVPLEVSGDTVAEVISAWTGIPVGKMVADEIRSVLQLAETLRQRVIGQDRALEAIAKRIRTSRARLDNPNRPVGVFLLAGPSGVGKTETALTLSEALYGGEQNLISINMSEYQEAHTVSSLKGSPPGYVGYGEGGVLTEAVRKRPYSVVLLDEVEKAHPDVMELFFQVFDKGVLEDGEGRQIDFKNTVILLTSNVGSETIMKLCADPETAPDSEALGAAIRTELLGRFPAALLGRMVLVPYYPIIGEALQRIIRLQLERIRRRVVDNHKVELSYEDALVDAIAQRCTEAESGARNIDNILTHGLLPELSSEFLSRMASGSAIRKVVIGVGADKAFRLEFS